MTRVRDLLGGVEAGWGVEVGVEVGVEDVLSRIRRDPGPRPFGEPVLDFCARLSRRLRAYAGEPDLVALAFWLRPAALGRLRAEVVDRPDGVVAVPRGLVLHLPPANVDTVWAYSWLLSALLGNRNVVRVPGSAGPGLLRLLDLVAGTLRECPAVAATTALLTWEHASPATAVVSAACDVRVVWGGDATVTALRGVPLPPTAREVSFPDRTSLCVLDAAAVGALDDADLARLAGGFVTDAYTFEQMACSSPRLVVWRGDPGETAGRFWDAVRRALDERPAPQVARSLDALTTAYEAAADGAAGRVEVRGIDLTVVRRSGRPTGEHPGGGLFDETVVGSWDELAALVSRRDQTVTVAGLSVDDARALVVACGARGVDRVVPVGRALAFERWWDGLDLVAELTRQVPVTV